MPHHFKINYSISDILSFFVLISSSFFLLLSENKKVLMQAQTEERCVNICIGENSRLLHKLMRFWETIK
jgi:hypothetical protein